MVVAGAVHGWAHDTIDSVLLAPSPGRPVRLYERGHATGVGVRSYADVVVAWAVCGQVHYTIERLSVEATPGRSLGGRRTREGSTMTDGSDGRRRSPEIRCEAAGSDVGRWSTEGRCGWLGLTRRAL